MAPDPAGRLRSGRAAQLQRGTAVGTSSWRLCPAVKVVRAGRRTERVRRSGPVRDAAGHAFGRSRRRPPAVSGDRTAVRGLASGSSAGGGPPCPAATRSGPCRGAPGGRIRCPGPQQPRIPGEACCGCESRAPRGRGAGLEEGRGGVLVRTPSPVRTTGRLGGGRKGVPATARPAGPVRVRVRVRVYWCVSARACACAC